MRLCAAHFRPFARRHGFTLVEVTIAIGIASFSLLSILGLMAVGMNTMRDAIHTSIQATITQEMIASLRQTDFSTVTSADWQRFYDDRGILTEDQALSVYETRVNFHPVPFLGGSNNPNVQKARVEIIKNGDTNGAYVFTTFLSNNGQ